MKPTEKTDGTKSEAAQSAPGGSGSDSFRAWDSCLVTSGSKVRRGKNCKEEHDGCGNAAEGGLKRGDRWDNNKNVKVRVKVLNDGSAGCHKGEPQIHHTDM